MNLPQNRAFCDTSFFFASLCPEDSNYGQAGRLLEAAYENRAILFTTWDVISETVTLLRYRASYAMAVQFLETVKPSLSVVHYDDTVRTEAEKIFKKLSTDKRISFCDALSFVVVTVLLDNIPYFSFDRDFKSLGLTVCP